MFEMNNLNPAQLVEAVRVSTGWGQSAMPSRSDQRLADQFGEDAAKLLPLIKSLENDFTFLMPGSLPPIFKRWKGWRLISSGKNIQLSRRKL